MITIALIAISLIIIVLLLYLGEIKFEFKINKTKESAASVDNIKPTDELSNTEFNILKLVAEGKTNQQIADELFISINTVKKHISHIFKKLSLKSRTEARRYKDQIIKR